MKIILAIFLMLLVSIIFSFRRKIKSGVCVFLYFIILSSVIFAFIIYKRTFYYPYEVKSDYKYSFNQSKSAQYQIVIKNNEFSLADSLKKKYNTGFIELKIKSSFLGKIIQPRITVSHENGNSDQFLEYRANGIRYLNISNFNNFNKLRLKLKCCKILNDTCKLILFDTPDLQKEKILILAPHPDDAEIAAYGLYSDYKNSVIVTITAGDASKIMKPYYENDSIAYRKSGEIRFWNSITIPQLGGINPNNAINLGYFDGTIKQLYSSNSEIITKSLFSGISDINVYRKLNYSNILTNRKSQSTWNFLVDDILYILNVVKPTIIITPHPNLDSHTDHKYTTIALFSALSKYNCDKLQLWLYTNHFQNNSFSFEPYPEGPIGSIVSLPPIFSDNLYFDGIYSHSLPVHKQTEKFFALDANNDLRLSPQESQSIKFMIKNTFNLILENTYNKNTSYYNRSIRNNELFFIVDSKNLHNIRIQY